MKKKFVNLIKKYIGFDETMKDFIDYIDELGFFETPASTQYHNSFDGGLAKHSLNVTNRAIELYNALKPDIPLSDLVFVSLFHDVGKIGLKDNPMYVKTIKGYIKKVNLNNNSICIKSEKGYIKQCEINHAVLSIYHLSKFFDLDEELIHAILYHNGLYDNLGKETIGKERQLTLILHWADMWASRFDEVRK